MLPRLARARSLAALARAAKGGDRWAPPLAHPPAFSPAAVAAAAAAAAAWPGSAAAAEEAAAVGASGVEDAAAAAGWATSLLRTPSQLAAWGRVADLLRRTADC